MCGVGAAVVGVRELSLVVYNVVGRAVSGTQDKPSLHSNEVSADATGVSVGAARRGMGASRPDGIGQRRGAKSLCAEHQAFKRPGSAISAASAFIGKEF